MWGADEQEEECWGGGREEETFWKGFKSDISPLPKSGRSTSTIQEQVQNDPRWESGAKKVFAPFFDGGRIPCTVGIAAAVRPMVDQPPFHKIRQTYSKRKTFCKWKW